MPHGDRDAGQRVGTPLGHLSSLWGMQLNFFFLEVKLHIIHSRKVLFRSHNSRCPHILTTNAR